MGSPDNQARAGPAPPAQSQPSLASPRERSRALMRHAHPRRDLACGGISTVLVRMAIQPAKVSPAVTIQILAEHLTLKTENCPQTP